MTLKTLFAALVAAVLAAGCVATVAPRTALLAEDFVPRAVVSNTFEIDSSRLALARSRDATVRRFAREMIRDHQRAGAELADATERAGLAAMRPALDERHRAMMADLSTAPARNFDAVYLDMQVAAHREAIDLFAGYARDGDRPALRRFADRTLPVLRDHAVHLTRILGEANADALAMR